MLFALKPKIFWKIFPTMLRDGLIRRTMIKNDKRPLPIGKNKKVAGLFNNELGGKIITEVVALRLKTCIFNG